MRYGHGSSPCKRKGESAESLWRTQGLEHREVVSGEGGSDGISANLNTSRKLDAHLADGPPSLIFTLWNKAHYEFTEVQYGPSLLCQRRTRRVQEDRGDCLASAVGHDAFVKWRVVVTCSRLRSIFERRNRKGIAIA